MSKTMEHVLHTIVRTTIVWAHSWPTWVRTAVTHCVTMASESPATCEARMVQADDDEEEVLFQSDDAVGPSCNPELLDTGTTETEQVLFDAATEANTPSEDTRDEDLQEADAADGQLGPLQGLALPVLGSARLPFNALAAAKYCYQVASRGGLESTTVPPQLRRLMYLRWFGVVRGQTPRDWLDELRHFGQSCFTGFCLLVAWAAFGKAEDVVTLTGSDFEQHLKDNKYVLAEFYAPWCGHCKKLAPEYEKAAQALKFSGVSLAKVDATEEKDLAKKYDVKGFPTLIWFEEGKQMEYSGGRTTQTIIDWASSMTGPAVLENSDPAPPGSERPRVVLQASSLDSVFEQVAKDHRRKATWYFQKTGGASKVILQHAGEDPVELPGALENATLTQFVLDNALPLVGELNADTFDKYLEAGKGLVWSLFPVKAGEGFEEHRGIMTDVGKRFRGKYFVTHTDTAKFKEAIDNMLGISKFPAIAVQKKAGDKKKFVYTGAMTAAQISQFIEDVSTGKVSPSLKSEPKPAANDDAVRVVVGSTFEQEVFTPDKDVLLEVYAPWCGHCKKLEPEYSKLAKKIKKEELSDLLSIAKIDGTANDSPVDFIDWSSFPTIFFVKAGQSNATVYDGERTAKGLWKYIRKHATKAQELRERLDRRKVLSNNLPGEVGPLAAKVASYSSPEVLGASDLEFL
ncbi:PDIL1-4 [Symbiodinium sp. KB8]|nr:PDIL1-4 [Symbiodinium sp. KB8]